MQIAMVAVRMVERPGDVVVDVIAVRDLVVPAGGPVPIAALDGGAGARPRPVHLEPVLVQVPRVGSVEMPVVEVVRVVAVAHGLVSARGSVLMRVAFVFAAGHAPPPRASSRARPPRSIVG